MRHFLFTLFIILSCATSHAANAQSQFKGLNIVTAEAITAPAPINGDAAAQPVINEMTNEVTSEMTASPEAIPNEHAEGHEGSSGLPQFNPASWPSQIFWLTIIFGSFYALSTFWIVPKMGSIVTARADYIADNLKQAEQLSNDAHHIKDGYETSLKSSQAQAVNAIADVQNNAKIRLQTAMNDLRQKQDTEVAATEAKINAAKADAMQDMNKIVATVAASAAEKIAGVKADASSAENVVKLLTDKKAKAA